MSLFTSLLKKSKSVKNDNLGRKCWQDWRYFYTSPDLSRKCLILSTSSFPLSISLSLSLSITVELSLPCPLSHFLPLFHYFNISFSISLSFFLSLSLSLFLWGKLDVGWHIFRSTAAPDLRLRTWNRFLESGNNERGKIGFAIGPLSSTIHCDLKSYGKYGLRKYLRFGTIGFLMQVLIFVLKGTFCFFCENGLKLVQEK